MNRLRLDFFFGYVGTIIGIYGIIPIPLLFAGLCCLAGPDGVVSASFQVVCDTIGAEIFPASKLDLLDREGWISLAEADGIVVCSIVGWQHVADNLEAIVSSLPKGEDVTDSKSIFQPSFILFIPVSNTPLILE